MEVTGSRRSAYLGLAIGVLAVSTSAVLIRLAGDGGVPLLAIAFWRCALGAVVLAPFAARARTRGQRIEPRDRRTLAASGVFLALHFALFIGSLSLTTVASSVTLVTMSPVLVALGASRFLGERATRRTWMGLTASIFGALVIGLADLTTVSLGPRALAGDAMAFGGTVAIAPYLLLGRVARRRIGASTYSASVFAVAAVVLGIVVVATGTNLTDYELRGWLAIAGLVVGPQLLGHGMFNAMLARVPPLVVSVVTVAEPVGATLLAWLVLREAPAVLFWAGAPLVLVGVLIATTRRRGTRVVGRVLVAGSEPQQRQEGSLDLDADQPTT